METESADVRPSSENIDEGASKDSEPNRSNEPLVVNTDDHNSSSTSETSKVPNNEVGNYESSNDGLGNPGVVDDKTSIFMPQDDEVLVVDVVEVEETLIVPQTVEPEPEITEATSSEIVSMITDASPVVENQMIVHEYPTAGISFDPQFGELLPYHQLVGGLSVPIGYAAMYKELWEMYGHIVVTRDPERSYFMTQQVEAILRVIDDIRITARNAVTQDVLFDWDTT